MKYCKRRIQPFHREKSVSEIKHDNINGIYDDACFFVRKDMKSYPGRIEDVIGLNWMDVLYQQIRSYIRDYETLRGL